MENKQKTYWEQGVDLKRLVLVLGRKLWFILVAAILGAVLGGLTYKVVTNITDGEPEYRASADYYINKWRDWHEMPYTMNIDFDLMLRSLRKINYQGYLTMEVDSFRHPDDPDNIANGIKTLYNTARKLADVYDAMW